MANRYWVGGTGTWNDSSTTNWSATSGGSGGASIPGTSDAVFFDGNSGSGTVTVDTFSTINCGSLTFTGYTGTFAGSSNANINIYGNLTVVAGMTHSYSGEYIFKGTASITSAGKNLGSITVNGAGITVTLSDALTCSDLTVSNGTFTTNNFNITGTSLALSAGTINLGSSTVTLSGNTNTVDISGGTLNAGTSQITLSGTGPDINGNGKTFYNVTFSSTSLNTANISDVNTFNNLTFTGRTSSGIGEVRIFANQTINGTLTVSNSTDATCRTFIKSNVRTTVRTLTCASIASMRDVDFQAITIAGAASPLSGTRLGDCKGNTGITFVGGKTVYFRNTGNSNWGNSSSWSATSGGAADVTYFPLAQDTAVFPAATYPASGSTVTMNDTYNVGTLDLSLRTSNTVNVSGSINIYGNLICGTGGNITGSGSTTFQGCTTQQVTCAGNTLATSIVVYDIAGASTTLSLQDAMIATSITAADSTTVTTNDYNVTLSTSASFTGAALNIGSSTITISAASGTVWEANSGLSITGTGTISLTGSGAGTKTFVGGGNQSYPTVNQGGSAILAVTGSNKFANFTNTYSATGATTVTFASGETNEFTAFNITGSSGKVCTLKASTTSVTTLKKSTQWYVGANSTDSGNNKNLLFAAGDGIDYLNISYISGLPVLGSGFLIFFN